ncbi:MAG TPA: nitrate reductase associated protein [bacterium]|nr:nitrate reductase associated protein [bacterium]
MSYQYQFEQEIYSAIEPIPLSAQFRMDSIGVKIRPETWNVLSKETRLLFSHISVKSEKDRECFKIYFLYLLKRKRRQVHLMDREEIARERNEWENLIQIPARVYQMAVDLDYTLFQEDWIKLSDFKRYALVKLSKGHYSESYLRKALAELFGFEPQVPAWNSKSANYSGSLEQAI